MKWAGPDGVVVDISHTGWDNGIHEPAKFTICVGTIGSGAWVSPDGGESWQRVRSGLWGESRVFGLAVHPNGAAHRLCRSR